MNRITHAPRPDWVTKVEAKGLLYHHHVGEDGQPMEQVYWNERAHYELRMSEVLKLEAATNELQTMCLAAGQHIIDGKRYDEFGIPARMVPHIERTWDEEPPAIYGRFDLAYDGHAIKLLEYNADTPTGLVEAAVAQWCWLQDLDRTLDQWNSIHERLVRKWTELRDYCSPRIHLTCKPTRTKEDEMTIAYLAQTAMDAGFDAHCLSIDEIGWTGTRFVDDRDDPIASIFKLYPWEWLAHEEFGGHLYQRGGDEQWLEPPWKMLWSNKALLAVLWELYPEHSLLLEASCSPLSGPFVKKPKMSREGASISIPHLGIETDGDYGEEGFVYQEFFDAGTHDGQRAVLGSWVVDGESAGLGIRETDGVVTDNGSCFVPHLIRG